MCSFKIPFLLELASRCLKELNILNIKVQYDMVDITTISATIDITILISSRHFLSGSGPMFGSYKQKFGKKLEGICIKSLVGLWKQYRRLYYSCIGNLTGPMNYNNAYYLVHLMCKELFMLWMIVSQTFRSSTQPNFSSLIIIQAMIVTESQTPNCGSEKYCWSFNILKRKMTCARENSWNLQKHFDMSVITKQYLRLGAYVVATWNDTQIGLKFYNFGWKLYSFHQV